MYTEREDYANGYRIKYMRGIEKVIDDRRKESISKRDRFFKNISQNREEYREKYLDMLGWPLNEQPQGILSVNENPVYSDDETEIVRLQFELFEGYLFYGVLIRHKTDKALPLVISQHGGWGTPEICSSFFDSSNYNDMSMRIFNKGVNVFAPQLDLWQANRFGPDGKRDEFDLKLKQLGGSIAALEIYSIERCLDYFETQPYCNKVFGMAGLSYGGFYTLYTAAADTRIKAALTCSHFNDRTKYNWQSKCFFDAANTFCDAEVGALVFPRSLAIEVGDNDELFTPETAQSEFLRLEKYYAEKPENVRFHIFKGVHEFCPDNNDAIDWMISRL